MMCVGAGQIAAAASLWCGGGKSGLRRTGRWVTPSPGNRKESATERKPPSSTHEVVGGKGERVR